MELKDENPTGNHIQNQEVDTVNPYNGIERLHTKHQKLIVNPRIHTMELKDFPCCKQPGNRDRQRQNPYNGIESKPALKPRTPQATEVNPYNGIERPLCLGDCNICWLLNPYNGIESICFPSVESHCSW